MTIDDRIRLVLPISQTVTAYHTPISREVFEANYRIISATHSALFGKGLEYAAQAGPVVARLRLLDEGRKDAIERKEFDRDGNPTDGGALALLREIKRLTVILVPGKDGWDMLPVDEAIRAGHIDSEEWSEVEAAIVFFTCPCQMARRQVRKAVADAVSSVMGGSVTPLDLTEWIASLPKSTAV